MQNIKLDKILPAVTYPNVNNALKVATAIKMGGLNVMEVTFRTTAAEDCIKMIRAELPEMQVGAGTILTIEQLHNAKKAGAQFGLAPGFNPKIVKEAHQINFPFIPGVMTPSEVEIAIESGCRILKLFPAAQINGIEFLKSLDGPFGFTGIKFVPMGGVNLQNMNAYLALRNVISIGGSWLAPSNLITEENYKKIEENVIDALNVINKN